jgi:hypothetical protein
MKVKALLNCNGVGYENFKKDEIRNLPKKLAEVLVKYKYVEEIVESKNDESKNDDSSEEDK